MQQSSRGAGLGKWLSHEQLLLHRDDHLAKQKALHYELEGMAALIREIILEKYHDVLDGDTDVSAKLEVIDGASNDHADLDVIGKEEVVKELKKVESDLVSYVQQKADILQLLKDPPTDCGLPNLIDYFIEVELAIKRAKSTRKVLVAKLGPPVEGNGCSATGESSEYGAGSEVLNVEIQSKQGLKLVDYPSDRDE
ncbi:unnamed protein product [Linum trigynum]|uniref:Uncharacterized protein n=1 Tax=Linum trigynum TaxID=586398 RepID=A0AAV2DTQ7_9ROSI